MAVYQVGADGKAQKGLKAGDQVVTGGGVYTISGVNADGTYQTGSADASAGTADTMQGVSDIYNAYTQKNAAQVPAHYYTASDQSGYISGINDAAVQQQTAALKTAYDQKLAALDKQAAAVPQTYDAAKNDTASDAAIAQKNLNERMAASGLNNGAGGQASLAMNNRLQSDLSALDLAKAQKLSEIEQSRTDAAAEYQDAIAEAVAKGAYEAAKNLYDEAVRVDNSYTEAADVVGSVYDTQKSQASGGTQSAVSVNSGTANSGGTQNGTGGAKTLTAEELAKLYAAKGGSGSGMIRSTNLRTEA